MRRWMIGLGATALLAASWGAGCAAGNDTTNGGVGGDGSGGATSTGSAAGGDGTAFVGPFVSRKTYSASSSRAGASPPSSSREESSSSGGIKVG